MDGERGKVGAEDAAARDATEWKADDVERCTAAFDCEGTEERHSSLCEVQRVRVFSNREGGREPEKGRLTVRWAIWLLRSLRSEARRHTD